MAQYIPSLEKVQVGLETAWGDLAVPTVQLVGVTSCRITPRVESTQIKDIRGTTMPSYISVVNRAWAEADVSGVVVYTHFRHWLDAMFGIDATAPYAYLAELDPTTTIRSFNLLHGQPDIDYSAGGLIIDRLRISGSTNGPLTYTAHLLGKGVVDDTLEVLTDDAVVVAMGNHCALWIDPIAGPIGTTAVTTTAFAFEMDIAVDRALVWHLGSLNPSTFRHGPWSGSLRLSLEMTATMQNILDAIIANDTEPNAYAVRIRATDGLTTSVLTLDMAGDALVSPEMYTSDEGVTTLDLNLVSKFSDDASFLSCFGAALTLP